jgi:hypothetical protein
VAVVLRDARSALLRMTGLDLSSLLHFKHIGSFSRHDARALQESFALREEGAGNAGCLLHPRSRVRMCAKMVHTSIQVQSEQPGIPCAVVLRLMPRSPWRRILFASIAAGLMAGRSGWIDLATGSLAPATGVGTTRFCRTLQRHTSCAPCSLTDNRPANTLTRLTLPRPPLPAPTFVTMANAPLAGRDGASCKADLG